MQAAHDAGVSPVWVRDFTYIKFQGALEDALTRVVDHPVYLHSDQGSDHDSQAYRVVAESAGIICSMSDKGSPWQNGTRSV